VRIDALAAVSEVRRRKLVAANYVPHAPFPRQQEFLSLDCFEALYGGAAGGGKSDAILMAAAQYLHVPGYAALILRKSYTDLALEDAIMARAEGWWAGLDGIKWDAKEKRCEFPAGSSITFGYLDTEMDKYRYQSAAYQFIGFDELTQFTQSRYSYLTSRCRRSASCKIPLRIRAASNPGGIGHDWVFKRFVNPDTALAPFVPAHLADNFHLDRESYVVTLSGLDPVTRKQLLEGVWIRDGGGLVYEQFNEQRNEVAPAALPKLDYYICSLDFGVVDQNGICVLGWRDHDPHIYVVRAYRLKGLVADVAAEVSSLDGIYHFIKIVGDVGGMGKLFQAELLSRFSLAVSPAEKTNKLGYIRLLNSDLALGRVKVVSGPATANLVEEWVSLPWNDNRLKEADGFSNHAADAALYGFRACMAYLETPKEEKPKAGSAEQIARMAAELERLAFEDVEKMQEEQRWL